MSPRRTFTLVELMIVVAIIAILAAVAIPFLAGYQLRARRAEAVSNVSALVTATMAWSADNQGLTLASGAQFPNPVGKTAQAWTGAPAAFAQLGWTPDGLVRCGYIFSVTGGNGVYSALVNCDIDEDTTVFRISRDGNVSTTTNPTSWTYCKVAVVGTTCTVGVDPGCDCY